MEPIAGADGVVAAKDRKWLEDIIRPTMKINLAKRLQSKVCPDLVNLRWDDLGWFEEGKENRVPSDFSRIARTARLNGWQIHYYDHGIGHDSHMLLHPVERMLMIVHYRSALAMAAELDEDPLSLSRILPTLALEEEEI